MKDPFTLKRLKNRLANQGADHLSNQELLKILFPEKESAHNLLTAFDENIREIFSASIEELMKVKGTGFTRACQIQVIFELTKRIAPYTEEDYPHIKSTDDIVMLLAPHMMHLKQEEFRVVLLTSRGRVIRSHIMSRGSLDQTTVHPRDVFRPAIAANAACIILVHNHPSGDPTPSDQDLLLTRELCMCSKIIGIEIIDHVIIGFNNYVSMKKRELM